MLWLAGLIGLMAVGAFMFLDFGSDATEDQPVVAEQNGALERVMSQRLVPEDDEDIDLEESGALDAVLTNDDDVWTDPLAEFALKDLADADAFDELAADTQGDADESDDMPDDDDTPVQRAEMLEFDRATDSLIVVWDDAMGAAPVIEMSENLDDPAVTDILADGQIVAQVPTDSGLSAQNIAIAPLSTAQSLGWASA